MKTVAKLFVPINLPAIAGEFGSGSWNWFWCHYDDLGNYDSLWNYTGDFKRNLSWLNGC